MEKAEPKGVPEGPAHPICFQNAGFDAALRGDLRLALDRRTPAEDILASWASQIESFNSLRKRCILYPD